MTIAIDFDGTCVKHEFPNVGGDIGAAPVLRKLVANGHKLILYTMRSNCSESNGASDEFPEITTGNFLDDAIAWFALNSIPLYGVQTNPTQSKWTSSPKCYAQMYIDDCALGVPLVIPTEGRSYVNWHRVEYLLKSLGLIQ